MGKILNRWGVNMKFVHSILFVMLLGSVVLLTAGTGGDWEEKRIAAAVRAMNAKR
jgi:hypothetical protein